MPVPRDDAETLRPLALREPETVLDADRLYTVYEIARLLQGIEPDAELDPGTEDILLDWTIPWMLQNNDAFVFAEPDSDADPGYYGLATE